MDYSTIQKIKEKYGLLSNDNLLVKKSVDLLDFNDLHKNILEKGQFFILKLKSQDEIDADKIISQRLPDAKIIKLSKREWRAAYFFGYKTKLTVEAIATAIEEYYPIIILENSFRKWDIAIEKFFELEQINIEDKFKNIISDDFNQATDRAENLLKQEIRQPIGAFERVLKKIDQEKNKVKTKKIEDIERYDKQKKDEVEKEIKDLENKINDLRVIDEQARMGKGPRSLERIENVQEEIKELELKKYQIENNKGVKLEKLDTEKQSAIFNLEKSLELLVLADLLQVGKINYESIVGELVLGKEKKEFEIILATGELILSEDNKSGSIVEPEFEILPVGVEEVIPKNIISVYYLIFKWSLILWILLILCGLFLIYIKPQILSVVLGFIFTAIGLLKIVSNFIEKYKKRIKILEDVQKDLTKIDKMTWREFEFFVGDLFEKMGYKVERIGGWGGDYGADLIATDTKTGKRYAVQAKRWNTFKVNTSAIKEVLLAWSIYDCDAGIVVTNNYFTERAGILPTKIKKVRVDLWDRDILIEKLKSIKN